MSLLAFEFLMLSLYNKLIYFHNNQFYSFSLLNLHTPCYKAFELGFNFYLPKDL